MSVLLNAAREKNRKKNRLQPKLKKTGKKTNTHSPSGYIPNATTKVWNTNVNNEFVSVALQTGTMDVWVNDQLAETTDKFDDDGAVIDFCIFDHKARIQITSSGHSEKGMNHVMTLDGVKIEQSKMAAT